MTALALKWEKSPGLAGNHSARCGSFYLVVSDESGKWAVRYCVDYTGVSTYPSGTYETMELAQVAAEQIALNAALAMCQALGLAMTQWTPVEEWKPVGGEKVYARVAYRHASVLQEQTAELIDYTTAVHSSIGDGMWIKDKIGVVTHVMAIPKHVRGGNANQA